MTVLVGTTLDRRAVLVGLAASVASTSARAQAWPSGPVEVIIPFPPGSTPDLVARVVAEHFRDAFAQPFVALNRPGAGGTIGTGAVAAATGGHTIGVTINGPITTAPALYADLRYDPAADLALVSLLVRAPQLLVVHPDVPARDLAGFIAYAKAHPGALSYGSAGAGSASHLAMEDLKERAGLDLVHVPYKGFPEATVDLVAGRIGAMFLITTAVLPQVRAGEVRALAVTAERPVPQAPEVPTLAAAGVPDATSYAWIGLVAPAGTPSPVVARLAAEARAGLSDRDRRERLERVGYEVVASSPEAFAELAASETRRSGELIRRLGLAARE